MSTNRADGAQGTPFSRSWEGRVTLVEYAGRPVLVARELGAMLGYGDSGKKLVDLITDEWSDEFLVDVDVVVLRNGRLADFKRICSALGLDLVDKRAPSLLLLTESGIQLVLARTEKPEGKAFRRWLVSEVIPAYHAARALPGPSAPPELAGGPPALKTLSAESSALASPPPPPPPPPPAPPTAVTVLRSLLEAYRAAGLVKAAAWFPLDVVLRQLESLPDPLRGLDALPIPGVVEEEPTSPVSMARTVVLMRIYAGLAGLRGSDLERLDAWIATRPHALPAQPPPLALVDRRRSS